MQRHSRTTLAATALLLLALAPGTSVLAAQQKVDIRRPVAANVSVRLMGGFSSLTVQQWAHDSIALTGTLGPGSRLEGGPLNFTGPASGMKFYVDVSSDAGVAGSRLALRLPRGASLWVKAGSADVRVEGIAGTVDINVIGGSVHVTGKPRELIVEAMDGNVYYSCYAEYARLKTASGNITMENGGGGDLTFTTVSGTIQAATGQRELARARFESVTGPITFAGALPRGADVRFDTHSGAVDVRLSANSGGAPDLDILTITGTIENRLSSARPIAGREGRGMELSSSSDAGSPRISVRSFKGNVRLAPLP